MRELNRHWGIWGVWRTIFMMIVLGGAAFTAKAQSTLDKAPEEVLTAKEEILLSNKESKNLLALVVEAGDDSICVIKQKTFSLKAPCLVPQGTEFQVPKLNQVTFRPMPGITAIVDSDTNLQIANIGFEKKNGKILQRRAYVYLKEGSVFSSLKKFDNKATSYAVQSPQGIVAAKGTQFHVSYIKGEGKVMVLNGVVEVKLFSGSSTQITAGKVLEIKGKGKDAVLGQIRPPNAGEVSQMDGFFKRATEMEKKETPTSNPFYNVTEAIDQITPQSAEQQIKNPANEIIGASEPISTTSGPLSEVPPNPDNTPNPPTPPVSTPGPP